MSRINLPEISKQKLFSSNIEEIHQGIEERKNERILQIAKATPNFIKEIPEQKMLIILIDIVGFSKSTTRQQVYEIYLFQRFIVSQVLTSKLDFSRKIHISNFIPTGDGCYIVADECEPEVALNFLLTLIKGYAYIQKDEEKPCSLRVSAEIGNVVPIIDIAKHKNFIGEGMNEAARILSYGQKALEDEYLKLHENEPVENAKKYSRNSLYLSDSFKDLVKDFEDDCSKTFIFKNVSDKHGKTRNINVLQGIS